MLDCVMYGVRFGLVGGAVLGVIVGLFAGPLSAVMRRESTRREWEEKKRKHGALKAWAIVTGEMALWATLALFFVGLFQCCRGNAV